MSGKFNSNYIAIRTAFNEAKVLLEKKDISIFEYRSLLNSLLTEVKILDEDYNNQDIKELLDTLINTERNKKNKAKD